MGKPRQIQSWLIVVLTTALIGSQAALSSLLVAVGWSAPQSSTSTHSPVLVPSNNYIYFVVSAKNLAGADTDRDGVADPFVKVFLGTEPSTGDKPVDSTNLEPLAVSETLDNENNPSWKKVFQVKHVQGTKQLVYLEVRDHDPVNPDDVIGDAFINLDNFVAKGEYTKVLEKAKSGSVTVTRTTPIYFDITLQ